MPIFFHKLFSEPMLIALFFYQFQKSAGKPVMAKIPIQWCAMNVFLQYMCDVKFEYSEAKFQKMTKDFDLIFEDINNGHPTDFLPWLVPVFKGELNRVKNIASDIRTFILENIVEKYSNTENPDKTRNLMEGLLANHKVIILLYIHLFYSLPSTETPPEL